MNRDCLWCTPLGNCGPAPSTDNINLAPCEPKEGCGFEPREWRPAPKRPVSGGSEEERLP